MISGTTSIPIHYLGLLDLLKNRATGDNTRELIMAGTVRERMIWVGVFEELVEKAMGMYNSKTGLAQKTAQTRPEEDQVKIPVVSEDQWTHSERAHPGGPGRHHLEGDGGGDDSRHRCRG